ncbi:hypothetical protein EBZ57_00240 [bacterium]|nr:hypothetical protein [bacterium]
MEKFNQSAKYENEEQPISERFTEFVISHIEDYETPRGLGDKKESTYVIDKSKQVMPFRHLVFSVMNNDDIYMEDIDSSFISLDFYMDYGKDANKNMSLVLVRPNGVESTGGYFFLHNDNDIDIDVTDGFVEDIIGSVGDIDLKQEANSL